MSIDAKKLEEIIHAQLSALINHSHTEDNCVYCELTHKLRECPLYIEYCATAALSILQKKNIAIPNECFIVGYFCGRASRDVEVLEEMIKKGE